MRRYVWHCWLMVQVFSWLPNITQPDTNVTTMAPITLESLPLQGSYVQYSGSLTTPPCTEGVSWVVMVNEVCTSRWACVLNRFQKSVYLEKYFQQFNRSKSPLYLKLSRELYESFFVLGHPFLATVSVHGFFLHRMVQCQPSYCLRTTYLTRT